MLRTMSRSQQMSTRFPKRCSGSRSTRARSGTSRRVISRNRSVSARYSRIPSGRSQSSTNATAAAVALCRTATDWPFISICVGNIRVICSDSVDDQVPDAKP